VGTSLCPRGGEQRGLAIKLPAHPASFLNKFILNPNFPLNRKFVIPAKAGIQMIKKPCEAGQNKGADRCAKYYFCWIPAFAGMTGLMENLG
jgi:hypothetical protein